MFEYKKEEDRQGESRRKRQKIDSEKKDTRIKRNLEEKRTEREAKLNDVKKRN